MRVRLIGYWRDTLGVFPDTDVSWPDPRDFVDTTWDAQERDLVASYLSEGYVPWIGMGASLCRLCGEENGNKEFTDGVYLWPEGLAHYVRDHAVKLPDEVLSHIRRRLDAPEPLEIDRDRWGFEAFNEVDRDWWRGFGGS